MQSRSSPWVSFIIHQATSGYRFQANSESLQAPFIPFLLLDSPSDLPMTHDRAIEPLEGYLRGLSASHTTASVQLYWGQLMGESLQIHWKPLESH